LIELLDVDPTLYLKCTRSYLWSGLDGYGRMKAQLSFYEWFLANYSSEQIIHFYKKSHSTVCNFAIKDRQVEVLLRPALNLGREGELAAVLCLDGQVLMKASFTVLPNDAMGLPGTGYAMFVGAFQGEKNTLELFKELTLLMERTKPSHLLFNVLQSLAHTWRLQTIAGVSDSAHAYASYSQTLAKRVKTNYDQIWEELGGERDKQGVYWILPCTWVAKDVSEVESKKRAAYRRRNALRQAFLDACASSAPALLHGPNAHENP
jgi:uncharacterized protein VirK/YbjX